MLPPRTRRAIVRSMSMADADASPNREFLVTGWAQSKASTNSDGGVGALLEFLEKKASPPNGMPLKILRHERVGGALHISVRSETSERFAHLNGFTFAGVKLSVLDVHQTEPGVDSSNMSPRRPTKPTTTTNPSPGSDPDSLRAGMIAVLKKRYDPVNKLLNLSSIGADPDLQQLKLFGGTTSPAKAFAALMKTCDEIWETSAKKREMVPSITVSNNNLTSVSDIISLAVTFPHLKNLDLANNQIADTEGLKFWRYKFRDLEHLIFAGNPIDLKPETRGLMKKWYRSLKLYNLLPIDAEPGSVQNPCAPVNPQQSGTSPSFTQPHSSPIPSIPQPSIPHHPEVPPESDFGRLVPGKSEQQFMQEMKKLELSFKTKMKLQWAEDCLVPNGWDLERAFADFQMLMQAGKMPAEAFLQV